MLTPNVILLLCCETLRGQVVLVEAIKPHEVPLHSILLLCTGMKEFGWEVLLHC